MIAALLVGLLMLHSPNLSVSITGQTAGTAALVRGDVLYLAGGSNITLSQDAQTISIVGGAGGPGGAGVQFSAGTRSDARTDLTFGDSNGISFGLNTAGVLTGTVATNYQSPGAYLTTAQPVGAYLTTAALSQDSSKYAGTGFTTTSVAGTAVAGTHDTAGLKLAVPAFLTTAQPVGAYLTTAALSQDSSKYAATGFTTTSTAGVVVAGTHDTAGLKLAVPAYLTTAQAVGAYLTTAALSQDSSKYAGTNGAITGGSITVNTSGVSVNLPAYLTTAMLSNAGSNFVAASAAFAGTNASGTIASNGISIAVAAPGGGGGFAAQGSGAYTQNTGTIAWANSNGVTFGLSTNQMTASINSTSGAGTGFTTTTAAGAVIAGTHDSAGLKLGVPAFLTTAALSQDSSKYAGTGFTTTATAGSVIVGTHDTAGLKLGVPPYITTSVPVTMSRWIGPAFEDKTLLSAPANAVASIVPVQIPNYLSGSRIDFFVFQSLSSTASAVTYGQQWSVYVQILTNDTAALKLNSLSSGSTQTTWTVASNTAGATQINGSAWRPISCPVNFNMTPGLYFVAVNWVTNTFSSGVATTALNRTASMVGIAMQSASYAMVGDYNVATGVTNNSLVPAGCVAASTGIPSALSYSAITMTGASRFQANLMLMFRNN